MFPKESPAARRRTTSARSKTLRGRPIALPVFVPCAWAARIFPATLINERAKSVDVTPLDEETLFQRITELKAELASTAELGELGECQIKKGSKR